MDGRVKLQAGVDVSGYNRAAREATGVQCKKRKNKSKGFFIPSNSLTTGEIDTEITAAKAFCPQLKRFIIATTGPRDSPLQEYIRKLNSANPPFKLAIWFWDDYVEFLNSNPNLMYKYYENILKYRQKYSENEHFLRLLALAFDRPAIRTEFQLENRAADFIQAISSLQQLVSSGVLKDGTGHVIDQARVPQDLPPELKKIRNTLSDIRTKTTAALNDKRIVDHGTVIEIHDPNLQIQLNQLRRDVVDNLNNLLVGAKIDPIEIRDY